MNSIHELVDGPNYAVASVFPIDLSGVLVVLRVCIDASRSRAGAFSVAGVAFGYDRAVKANAEWSRILKGRTFHMADLNARQGEFKGMSDDDVSDIMHGIVRIIRKYSSYIVSVSCDADLISEAMPELAHRSRESEEIRNGFRSIYGLMCHICMYSFGERARQNGSSKDSISYVLESGDKGQKGLLRYMRSIEDSSNAKVILDGYSYARLTSTSKDEMDGIFHSADFVAWEWGKHVERQKSGLPMRKSLAVLIGQDEAKIDHSGMTIHDQNKYSLRHFSERNMDRYVRVLRELIEAGSNDDVRQALTQWELSRCS